MTHTAARGVLRGAATSCGTGRRLLRFRNAATSGRYSRTFGRCQTGGAGSYRSARPGAESPQQRSCCGEEVTYSQPRPSRPRRHRRKGGRRLKPAYSRTAQQAVPCKGGRQQQVAALRRVVQQVAPCRQSSERCSSSTGGSFASPRPPSNRSEG